MALGGVDGAGPRDRAVADIDGDGARDDRTTGLVRASGDVEPASDAGAGAAGEGRARPDIAERDAIPSDEL